MCLSVEIELPDDVSDEYLDAMIQDLTYEKHKERLERVVHRWVRFITGEPCNITITVDDE